MASQQKKPELNCGLHCDHYASASIHAGKQTSTLICLHMKFVLSIKITTYFVLATIQNACSNNSNNNNSKAKTTRTLRTCDNACTGPKFLQCETTPLLLMHDANARSHKNSTEVDGDSFFQNRAACLQKNNVSIVV